MALVLVTYGKRGPYTVRTQLRTFGWGEVLGTRLTVLLIRGTVNRETIVADSHYAYCESQIFGKWLGWKFNP